MCIHEVCVSVCLCIYKCKGKRDGAALVLEKNTSDPTPWVEFPSLDSSVGVSKVRILGDTAYDLWISQFGGMAWSQPPRDSQEGEEHGGLSSIPWGERWSRPVSRVTKLGGTPCMCPACPMKAVMLDLTWDGRACL